MISKLLYISNNNAERIDHMLDAFLQRKDLKVKVEYLYLSKNKNSFLDKIFYKLKLPIDHDKINNRLLNQVKQFNPDYVFIVKGNNIYPSTLKKIKKFNNSIKIISWSLDDMYAWHNRSLFYTNGLKYYNIVFTSKSYNIEELKSIGAKRVDFLYQAYSNIYHKKFTDGENVDVLFIGFAEKERFSDLVYLADNGIVIDIYGSGWTKSDFQINHKNLKIHPYDLIGDDYARALSCAKISLCFLRKVNRDLHTSRSLEIPACGGFMLGERTNEHISLFEEDKEAVYFSSREELLEKVKIYLCDSEKRKRISDAGYKKTRNSDYSYDNMAKRILDATKTI